MDDNVRSKIATDAGSVEQEEEVVIQSQTVKAMSTLLDSVFSTVRARMSPVTEKLYDKKTHPMVDEVLTKIEGKTGIKRENLMYSTFAFLTIYYMIGSLAQLVVNVVGVLYPAWCSIKAVRSPTKEDDTTWLIYWITYGVLSILDCTMFSSLPFYWLAKGVFLIYLYLPHFKGAHTMYVNYIDPACTLIENYFTPKTKEN